MNYVSQLPEDLKIGLTNWLNKYPTHTVFSIQQTEEGLELQSMDIDEEAETEEEYQAWVEARKEHENGETLLVEDMSKLTSDEFLDLITKHLEKYEV